MTAAWWAQPLTTLMPGEPDGIENMSGELKATGEQLSQQASRLRGVSADIWKGEAANQFKQHIKKVPKDLDVLSKRYDGVAAALTGYARQLRTSQKKVTTAQARAAEAVASRAAADAAVREAEATNDWAQRSAASQNQAFPEQPPLVPSLTDVGPLQRRMGDADEQLRQAERLRIDAECERDAAARTCKRTIDDRIDDDLKDDSGWWAWTKKASKAAAPYLSIAGAIIGIAALFIPGLNLIAMGLLAASLLVDTVNAATDQGSWTDVGLGLVGVGAFKGIITGARTIRAAKSADAARDLQRATRTAKAIEKARKPAAVNRIAKRTRMSPAEIATARRAGNLKQVMRSRAANDMARADSALKVAQKEAARTSRPFRTMVSDFGQLVTRPGKQLSPTQLAEQARNELQLVRSGAPGTRYAHSVLADTSANAVDSGLAVHELRKREAIAEVHRRMAGVPPVAAPS